jgi:hypothetical protein
MGTIKETFKTYQVGAKSIEAASGKEAFITANRIQEKDEEQQEYIRTQVEDSYTRFK